MSKPKENSQVCVLCGNQPATTKDHVPPKTIFVKPRPNDMIKVPSCFSCNNDGSKADEEFSLFVCSNATIGKNDTSSALYKQKLIPTLNHNNRLRKQAVDEAKMVEITSKQGIYLGEAYAIKWSAKAHNDVIKRITRGLYYHHFNEILPQDVIVEPYWFGTIDQQLESIAQNLQKSSIGGDAFIYGYGRAHDAPYESFWFYQFHNSHFAGASTSQQ